MKLSIKTLKGELFKIDAEETDKVSDLKAKINDQKSDLIADRLKLIFSGKVLKDEQSVQELGLSETGFIVCMLTKEAAKKPAPAPTPAPAPITTPTSAIPATPINQPPTESSSNVNAPAKAQEKVEQTQLNQSNISDSSINPSVQTPMVSNRDQFVTPEGLQSLMGMGFSESESRQALTAAMGNPDVACEFLLSGFPPVSEQASFSQDSIAPTSTSEVSINDLRSHPQFNMLKRLIQENPSAISQVLDLIGQQNPALLEAIHANNDAFIAMMNEPIEESTSQPQPQQAQPQQTSTTGASSLGAMGSNNPMANPAQLVQMLSAMPPEQRSQFAQMMGLPAEQLEGLIGLMSSMPQENLQNMLSGAGQNAPGAEQAGQPGVIQLTPDEMEAVNRLTALGFSQQQAVQAYLACDKDESMAANLLFDGWGDDDEYGGGFEGGMDSN